MNLPICLLSAWAIYTIRKTGILFRTSSSYPFKTLYAYENKEKLSTVRIQTARYSCRRAIWSLFYDAIPKSLFSSNINCSFAEEGLPQGVQDLNLKKQF